jgi:hypothetical protein
MKMLHKILGCSTVAVALALSASTTQAQNLLTNPGFESAGGFVAGTGPGGSLTNAQVGLGWANNFGGSGQGPNDMSSSADSPHDGSYALLAVNGVGNAWNPQGSYQLVSGIAGNSYTYSIYALTDTGMFPGTGSSWTTPVDIQMQFLTSQLVNLNTVDLGWSALSANDQWQQFTVNGVAPAGTAYVSVYAFAMIGAWPAPPAPQQPAAINVYFDTASLTTPAPEPTTLALAGLGGAAALSLIRRRKV